MAGDSIIHGGYYDIWAGSSFTYLDSNSLPLPLIPVIATLPRQSVSWWTASPVEKARHLPNLIYPIYISVDNKRHIQCAEFGFPSFDMRTSSFIRGEFNIYTFIKTFRLAPYFRL